MHFLFVTYEDKRKNKEHLKQKSNEFKFADRAHSKLDNAR